MYCAGPSQHWSYDSVGWVGWIMRAAMWAELLSAAAALFSLIADSVVTNVLAAGCLALPLGGTGRGPDEPTANGIDDGVAFRAEPPARARGGSGASVSNPDRGPNHLTA